MHVAIYQAVNNHLLKRRCPLFNKNAMYNLTGIEFSFCDVQNYQGVRKISKIQSFLSLNC